MKNKAYNIICIVASVLFLLIMGGLTVLGVIAGFWYTMRALVVDHSLFEAVSFILECFIPILLPASAFVGCWMALKEFLKSIRKK